MACATGGILQPPDIGKTVAFPAISQQEAQLLLGWPTHGAKNDFRIRDLEMTSKAEPRSKVIADSEPTNANMPIAHLHKDTADFHILDIQMTPKRSLKVKGHVTLFRGNATEGWFPILLSSMSSRPALHHGDD